MEAPAVCPPRDARECRTEHLLIIEDDVELCGMLKPMLEQEGFRMHVTHDGAEGLELARGGEFDLAVLDVVLPGLGGLQVLQRIREASDLPVVMLSGRAGELHRILALELGADDYISKPFNPRELIARIRAIDRRLRGSRQPLRAVLAANGVTLDPALRMVECDGREVKLTGAEFDVLERLMRSPGVVLERHVLQGGPTLRPFDRSIDMHISHLRRKLQQITERELVKTVHGVGYQFLPGDQPSVA